MNATRKTRLFVGALALAGLGSVHAQSSPAPTAASAAPPPFVSRPIVVAPVSGDERKELVLIAVTIAPAGAVPMHVHPGDCVGSVIEGTVELLVAGQPARRLVAGEAYSNLRGIAHGFRNVGEGPARLLNSLHVDKGVARVQPAG